MGSDPSILVTGGGGQLGVAFAELNIAARILPRSVLDVTDANAVASHVRDADVVVHLAAVTDVDGCERDPAWAEAVNVEGTRLIVKAARRSGARVVYLSTDYVFDGEKGAEYLEDDAAQPINVYGRSKYRGEQQLDVAQDLVIRTSWVYGGDNDFFSKIRRAASVGQPLQVVDDQWGKPTFARDLADAVVFLIASGRSGVVNVSGDGDPTTWKELATMALGGKQVDGIDSQSFRRSRPKLVAPRPRFSALSLGKARGWGVPLRPWRTSLQTYLGVRG